MEKKNLTVKKKKEEPKGRDSCMHACTLLLSLLLPLSSLRVFWVGMPSHLEDVFSFIF